MASNDTSLFAYSSENDRKGKAPNALRTISEASDMLEVPQHVLRFWETKFSQIRPLKRNGGRRFYRPQDLDILQQVKFLLYSQGYTIKGAKKAIEDYARPGAAVETPEWLATVPPASVNDNEAQAPSNEQALAELAAELREETPVSPQESLREVREGLLAARDELTAALARAA
ncbi:MAG: MerR family transcriptional regulator [Alphaproteobacteria bacterium]